ncbi:TPA: hypothetical protein H1V70_004500 [Salmonella enterica]|nr:hypothetical protein [Salmonella enterica]
MTKYAYFKLSDKAAGEYMMRWWKDIYQVRGELIHSLQRELGAAGISLVSGLKAAQVESVWFGVKPPRFWIVKSSHLYIDGVRVREATPDITTIEGKERKALIGGYEEQLTKYPEFSVWLCNELNIDFTLNFFHPRSVWEMSRSRDGFSIVFKVHVFSDGEVHGHIPDECQRIKHSEFVALTEE